jgi:cation:H+ antiporter
MLLAWAQFLAVTVSIGFAGYHLSRCADRIARYTGLSGSWIGLLLVATVTSLPELTTGVTSVTIAQAPNVAVGNALGSCVINLGYLVIIDFMSRSESVFRRASPGHILSASFGVVLLGFVGLNLMAGTVANTTSRQSSGLDSAMAISTVIVLVLYLIAMRTVFVHERRNHAGPMPRDAQDADAGGLRSAIVGFTAAAVVVVAAGLWLPFAALELAEQMDWSRSFIGTLFVSIATTMPELAVTLSALRIGALDMAVGNLLGSNLFNLVILAIDDLFHRPGPLLAAVAPIHAMTAFSALTMTGLALVGLFYRPQRRFLRTFGWVSLGLLAILLLNGYAVFLFGDG